MTCKRVIEVLEECIDKLEAWRGWGRLSSKWRPDEDEAYYADRIKALELAIKCVKYLSIEIAKEKAAKKEAGK